MYSSVSGAMFVIPTPAGHPPSLVSLISSHLPVPQMMVGVEGQILQRICEQVL